MRKMSKLLAVVLAVAMLFAFALPASAASATAYALNPCLTYMGQSTQILFTDGSQVISATSSDPAHFIVTPNGVVTSYVAGTSVGYADITVRSANGNTGVVRVFAGSYPPGNVWGNTSISVGGTTSLTLVGATVNHAGTSDPRVATVTDNGMVIGVGNGTCTIYLLSNTGKAGSAQVTVGMGGSGGNTGNGATITSTNIQVGGTATIIPTSGTLLTVYSSNSSVASVTTSSGYGMVTGKSAGTATITYLTSTNQYGTFTVTVGGAGGNTGNGATITSTSITVGGTATIIPTSGTLTSVYSSNSSVASVTTASGYAVVTGKSAGTATITYVTTTGQYGTFNVTVGGGSGGNTGNGATITSTSITVGGTATIIPTSGTLTYVTSSNSSVASVTTSSGYAVVTGKSAGTATITYMTSTGQYGTFTVTVGGGSSGGGVTPSLSYDLEVGKSKTLTFSNQNVAKAWSSDTSMVSAELVTSSTGKVSAKFTALKAGTCVVYMSTASGATTGITLNIEGGDVVGMTGEINSGSDDLRVVARTGPGTSYSRKATLSNGVDVTITGESGNYYKVSFKSDGKTYSAYVQKAYIELD